MPRMATEQLTKVTLNLFHKDVEWFKDRYGQGWSEYLRASVRQHIHKTELVEKEFERLQR